MNRRQFCFAASAALATTLFPVGTVYAQTYLSADEARQLIWGDVAMTPQVVKLDEAQMKSIQESSETRVRHNEINAWRTPDGGWFIIDQVIGKHENIDIAVGLEQDGSVRGIEILVYRETYGDQVRNSKWRAQFHGRNYSEVLKLDKHIRNISGATLSCRHITDGINRLTHTWDQVLQHL